MCQYFAIEFPRPKNIIIELLRDDHLGRCRRGRDVSLRNLYLKDKNMLCVTKVTPCETLSMSFVVVFQANSYSDIELTLSDPTCKARMNGTHFILESPLNGCGTRHRPAAPGGVVYYNSVSVSRIEFGPWPEPLWVLP